MKANKGLPLLSLALAGVFLLAAAAEFFFSLGKDKVPERGLRPLRIAMKLFPLQGDYAGEAGFALMERGARAVDPASVKASIPFFKTAIARNPLDYRSHYYLAKAYLQLSALDNDYFDLGVGELRRAAFIHGSNKQIALDCAKVYFSLWPLLEEEDQGFAAGLLQRAMPQFSWDEFRPLVEMWSLYVQDPRLLSSLITVRPDFYGPVANQLLASGIDLSWRWQLLDQYEQYLLDANWRLHAEMLLKNKMNGEKARDMLNNLRVLGFNRLQPNSQFNADRFQELQRQLLLAIISGTLADPMAMADAKVSRELNRVIQRYVVEHGGLNSLEELQKLLEEREYFKANDFPSLRLKTLISLKKGDYNGVISEIEALRKGISFVKAEQTVDYTDILLMLVDSYYSSKLMTAAEEVVRQLYQEQPDNPDVLWRVLRIQKIMGSEGKPDPVLQERLAKVENSCFIKIDRAGNPFFAYLFNKPEIEITLDAAYRSKLGAKQLLQVFVDDQIAFESYVEGLPEKIVIGAPFVEIESKAKVQIDVL